MVEHIIRLHTEREPVCLATNQSFMRDYFQMGVTDQRTRCMDGIVLTPSSEFLDTLDSVREVMVTVVTASHRIGETPNITLSVCAKGSKDTTGTLTAISSIPYSNEGLARVEQLVQRYYSRRLVG